MTDLLWQKPGVAVDARIQQFLAGDDVVLDREFLPYDIRPAAAHAQGLQRIGILSRRRAGRHRSANSTRSPTTSARRASCSTSASRTATRPSRRAWSSGSATPGARIHTGRSRNDQVLVATRLWLKDRLARGAGAVPRGRGGRARRAPTRRRRCRCRAIPTCSAPSCRPAGMWWAAWAEAFIDNAMRARDTLDWVDANPLGTRRRLRRQPAAGPRPHHAGAGLRPHAGGRRSTRSCRAASSSWQRIEALGIGGARPAPAGLGPEPVHQRRVRLRRAAGAVHHRQFDHAEQAQSRTSSS